MQQLFVYGTIGDFEIFKLLLDREPVYRNARLNNYGLYIHPENGYLFVKPHPNQSVTGKVVEVSDDELKILDLWESVPLYQRSILDIEIDNQNKKAFVYTQHNTSGLPYNRSIEKDRDQIMHDIKEFRDWLKNNSY
ncbi:gamma-glutamylcyclotransferase family protein [Sunxiuqinia sp. A32]|uniref:gamma-glutamylcyclotransferase family protein n=1 Tax=Sunxiuqinia sp. A32 TaxID=3461496 RepID=UPI0040462E95